MLAHGRVGNQPPADKCIYDSSPLLQNRLSRQIRVSSRLAQGILIGLGKFRGHLALRETPPVHGHENIRRTHFLIGEFSNSRLLPASKSQQGHQSRKNVKGRGVKGRGSRGQSRGIAAHGLVFMSRGSCKAFASSRPSRQGRSRTGLRRYGSPGLKDAPLCLKQDASSSDCRHMMHPAPFA